MKPVSFVEAHTPFPKKKNDPCRAEKLGFHPKWERNLDIKLSNPLALIGTMCSPNWLSSAHVLPNFSFCPLQTMCPDVFRGPWGGSHCRDSPVQTIRKCSCAPGPTGGDGGTWWKVRVGREGHGGRSGAIKSLGERLMQFRGKVGKETKLESKPSLSHFSCPRPLSHLAVGKSTTCSHSPATRRPSPGSYLKELCELC